MTAALWIGTLSTLLALVAVWSAARAASTANAAATRTNELASQVALSEPIAGKKVLEELREEVRSQERRLASVAEGCDDALQAFGTKLARWRLDMEQVQEGIEDLLSRVERKRKSAAASASRAERAQNGEAEDVETVARRRFNEMLHREGWSG